MNKMYVISVSLLTFFVPAICVATEMYMNPGTVFSFMLCGKWFIFSAVGLRLFVAGIKQTTDPAFTAGKIFHIKSSDCFPIVRELGFANMCFGLIGIISMFQPHWRIVSAFGSGLYYGIAGLQHLFKKFAGVNEQFALVTDLLIFAFLLVYFVKAV